MARTDIQKVRQPAWVACPIPAYNDERHYLLPSTRSTSQEVADKSLVNEFRNGQMVRETDTNVFTVQWLKKHWLDWEHVGIVHPDGRVEDPAACTMDNRLLIANERGIQFLLWLQDASRELGLAAQQEQAQQEALFRPVNSAQTGLPESQL